MTFETPDHMEPDALRFDAQNRRLCSAHTKKGTPCRAPAVTGSKVCHRHGAAKGTPGRAAADQLTLSELVNPSLLALRDLIQSPTTSDAAKVSAIRTILERAGYQEAYELSERELEQELQKVIDRYLEDDRKRSGMTESQWRAYRQEQHRHDQAWRKRQAADWDDNAVRERIVSAEPKPKRTTSGPRKSGYRPDGTYGPIK